MDEATLILEQQSLPAYSALAPTLEYPEIRRTQRRARSQRCSAARTWGRTLWRTLIVLLLIGAILRSTGHHRAHLASRKLGVDVLLDLEVHFDR